MKLVLLALSTLIVISAGLSLRPSPRRDITFPRHVSLPDPDGAALESRKTRRGPTSGGEPEHTVKMTHSADGNPAKLRVSDTRRKKVKQVSTRENETTRVTTNAGKEQRMLHTKIVHVPEPFVVHVEKPYPVYIEKPFIVEKHLPMTIYITKKESKKH